VKFYAKLLPKNDGPGNKEAVKSLPKELKEETLG